jgi:hypothetical protein
MFYIICIHRQLIQSLSVTGACLDMSRLVVAKQKAHRQRDTGSKVIPINTAQEIDAKTAVKYQYQK